MSTTISIPSPRIVDALESAVAIHDHGTFEHSMRVSALARQIGKALGLASSSLEALGWAAALHDLGKLAVPEGILGKRGKLTPDEWDEIKSHPIVGSELILALSPALEPVALAVRAHHEQWDGSGYPDALIGEGIPILGRIISVADAFDALTHDRPYRAAPCSPRQAREMIDSGAGTQFDPTLVPVCLHIFAS